ncbi:MAG TPA: F0F1 ATP synthase subunit B [Saprospiraceae bacterium]|jgi:F-type H+-transporting ATPase subunit b|nr:F0F1 ATP synthase subunit B [Saprospiraceae bacterium]HRO09032.1 F0F1 ATP synthase subunit B [Saprospiraceae bacterium]HRO73159.1 F0F1 ATP synthase subunit B [Saprospiraceae bacterium]HRP42379.1 F0F1 ATP synthase subunit B [Saprospiraceae bacterium]
MFSLVTFTPFQPTPGLAIWSLVIFLIFWYIVSKFAFKPIAEALEKREEDIQNAMDAAKKTKEEMANMKAENEKLLAEAREERSKIIQEAKDIKNQMISEAKDKAKEEANKIVANAVTEIESLKRTAFTEVKNEIGTMALSIAEKVIKKELQGDANQEAFVNTLVKDIHLN